MTMGNPADGTEIELVRHWRKYMKEAKTIPPVEVASGALLENVKTGDDIDLFTIPVPRWHEHDGGYYIGTGDMVVMRDPDTGWINYGAYRVQAHDKKLATVMCSKGKHGDMIQKKYHERGLPCPVAVVCGMHPALFMIAGLEIPHGKNEYDAAGGLLGEPVQVIKGRRPVCRSRRMPRSPSRASSIRTTGSTRARSANGPAITPAVSRRSRRSASRP